LGLSGLGLVGSVDLPSIQGFGASVAIAQLCVPQKGKGVISSLFYPFIF